MKRLLMLGVAVASMGDLMQCPILIPPEGDNPRCDNIVVVTPPGSCFELPVDPCTHVPWTGGASITLSPEPPGLSLDWTVDASVATPALCVQDSIPRQTAYHYTFFMEGDAQGQGDFLVTAVSGLAVTASAAPGTINPGESSQLAVAVSGGTGPYHYEWDIDPTLSATNIASPIARPTATTIYRVVVSDAQNHSGQAVVSVEVATIEVPVRLTVSASATPSSVMAGQSVRLSADARGGDGHYHYSWAPQPSGDVSAPSASSVTTTLSTTTTYTVMVSDDHGLTASSQVTVTVTPAPVLAASFVFRQPTNTGVPFDVTLDASASTGNIVSYEWDLSWTGGGPDFITTGPIATFTRTQESLRGTITLTVRDASGNSATASRTYP